MELRWGCSHQPSPSFPYIRTYRDATATSTTDTAAKPKPNANPKPDPDEPPKKRPTRQTFAQFVELARPEAPAFLTALLAVAVVGFVVRIGMIVGWSRAHTT